MNIWRTKTVAVRTPRGTRYQGVSLDGREVRYRSPLRVHEGTAYELAREHTIHHNIWHDETPEAASVAHLHERRYCPERVTA
jgi:hypothetical protein